MEIILFTGSFEQEASKMDETENKKPGKELQEMLNLVFESPGRKALEEAHKLTTRITETLQRLGVDIDTADGEIGGILDDNAYALEEVAELLEKIEARQKQSTPIAATRHCMGISKLSNNLTKDFVNAGDIELRVSDRKKTEVLTIASLNYEGGNIQITGRQEFTTHDRNIHDAVCTLYAIGNRRIDPAQVYRHINNLDPTYPVNKEELIKVDKSMDKSRFMRLRVDYTAQAKLYGLDVDSAIIDSNLLSADVRIIKKGGYEVKTYIIKDTPTLYKYNALFKQIVSFDRKLLGLNGIDNTEENSNIKMYLLKRIGEMKYNPKSINKIKYKTMFEELKINPNADRKKKIRAKIEIMLQNWKNEKYITGFKEYKIGRTFEGIEIQYKQNKRKNPEN